MAADTENVSWLFGGALAGQPPALAWSIVAALAIGAIGYVVWSYRHALVELPPVKRAILSALRLAAGFTLLLILAAPTRVHHSYAQPPGARPLAVLVDESASMAAPDNRARRRLDDALRRWRELQPAARKAHSEVKTFAFASRMQPATPGDAPTGLGAEQTRLFAALRETLAHAPVGGWDSIVTLTDGLDTSGTALAEGVDATARDALAQSTALFFVPGRNRYAGQPFFSLRDFNVPARVAPHAKFRVEATFDSFQTQAHAVEVNLKVADAARPAVSLPLASGRRLATWSAEVAAGEPGTMEIELRAGSEIARATVRVARPSTNRILYFQGALDWSYRFLADILKRNPSFVLTPVFNFPNPAAVLPPGALRRMPEIPKELDGFDIVILANASAAQFTPAQQAALGTWVRGGGVVLFFTPDDDSSQGFAGSELEKMLPVLFAPPQPRAGTTARQVLARFGSSAGTAGTTKLTSFAWEESSRVREIFAEAERNKVTLVSPEFAEYAHVAAAKPGADVLARHPDDLVAGTQEHAILLAVQRYGSGSSAVLTTDALWRWKLNQPADDRSAEFFWQTLFAWLTRNRDAGLRFAEAPRVAEVGHELTLRVVGAKPEKLQVEAVAANRRVPLTSAAQDGGAQSVTWRPPTAGLWQITARDGTGEARHWITVKDNVATGELSGDPPDEELLRTLAERTGGSVLENAPPPAWQETRAERGALLGERRDPLWHRGWVFALLLGFYSSELILRRWWRML
jgi:hypothetical protein